MQAYLINLDRSPDRLSAMQAQFERLEMPWERICAFDGNWIEAVDPEIVDQKAFRWRHHAHLRKGEIGCYLSHIKALETFLGHRDQSVALILEDDVFLPHDLPEVLDGLFKADDWDLVKLYATHPGGVIPRRDLTRDHRLVSLAFRHGSACAYVVNRTAATKLLAKLLPMTVPYDHEFERSWKYGFRLRAILPPAVQRVSVASTITQTAPVSIERRAKRKPHHRPWYAQGGMVVFRGANDIARIFHETIGSLVR